MLPIFIRRGPAKPMSKADKAGYNAIITFLIVLAVPAGIFQIIEGRYFIGGILLLSGLLFFPRIKKQIK